MHIIAKQLHSKVLYVGSGLASSEFLRGFGIISSQVFGQIIIRGWIQTEACVIPSYLGMPQWQKQKSRKIIFLIF